MRRLHLLVPGSIDRPSGGSRYDRRIASELRELGWSVAITELDGAFPQADALARASLTNALAACADAALVLIDGLAGSALPEIVAAQAQRLRLVMLVHLPLADAVDLGEAQRELYFERERRALSATAGIVVTSRYSAARLSDYGVDAARITIVTAGVDVAAAQKLAAKVKSGAGFDLNDFLGQLQQMKQMGGLSSLMDKLPTQMAAKASEADMTRAERDIRRKEGIIQSMTPLERRKPELLKATRKRRIAAGAGVQVQEVNRLLNEFEQMQGMMKKMKGGGLMKMMKKMGGMKGMGGMGGPGGPKLPF